MSFMPNSRVFIAFGNLTITYYAICIALGTFIAYQFSKKNIEKLGYKKELLEDLFYGMLPVCIIGARAWYVAFEWQQYATNPIKILYIWEGGLGIYGGVLAGFAYAYFFLKKRKMSFLRFADAIVPNILIGQCLGRWGNFFNQEAFGRAVSEQYMSHFPAFIRDKMYINGTYYEPTFLYESIGTLSGWILINFLYRKSDERKRGDLFYSYLAWYGMVRFFIEGLRADALYLGSIRVSQLTSIILVIIGALGILGILEKFQKNRKPVLLFDADGTLIGTDELIFASFKHTFEKYVPDHTLTQEELLSFLGPSLEESFGRYVSDPAIIDEMITYYRKHNVEHTEELIQKYPLCKETIHSLKEQGYKLGVVSTKFTNQVLLGLKACEIDEYFDVVLGRDKVEHLKPSPEGLFKACDELNESYDYLVYIGDSVTDIQAGKAAMAYTIGITWSPKGRDALDALHPDYMMSSYGELENIIKEIHYRGN